jgi:hypothetical protein
MRGTRLTGKLAAAAAVTAAAALSSAAAAPAATGGNGLAAPAEFGRYWAHVFNANQQRLHAPLRFTTIACRRAKSRFYVCEATARDLQAKRVYCVVLAIAPDGAILGGRKLDCQRAGVA